MTTLGLKDLSATVSMLWGDRSALVHAAWAFVFATTALAAQTQNTNPTDKPAQKPGPVVTHEETRRPRFDAVHKEQGEIRFRYAKELRSYGYRERARDEFETFLILFPGHPRQVEAWIEVGEISHGLGESERAVKAYLKAYHGSFRDERAAVAAVRAARILIDRGDTERAREILDEIVRQWPSSRPSRLAEAERAQIKGGSSEKDASEMPEKEPQEKKAADEIGPEKSDNKGKDSPSGKDLMGEGVDDP